MKISIIGAGVVGSSIAFAIMDKPDEIELVDIKVEKAMAEALDLTDAARVLNIPISISWSSDPGKADIYIICAGKRREKDNNNAPIIFNRDLVNALCKKISQVNTDPWVIMVTNPTGELVNECNLYFRKVISSGRHLDNARSGIIGPHEDVKNIAKERYMAIRDGKGYTNWTVAAEVRRIIEGIRVERDA